ncbi:hypothetical protein CN271_13175 [Bacillus cereus]|uniref:hypothetical protein n=1 Tax=Bacillus cereus TaxID=1396 RepID=UPI000BEE1CAD|nr:hypothetical protein [Bacillus cereus]PEE32950.1 hypothetical protein CON59_28235 [Bacillus cereus]PET33915.1 hypothetical protein CN523_31925 [Bacillus cereus]PEV72242.1 hypothetical protein CN429_29640 [Bacillus cereus]PFA39182.1 hypothetical protein CN389_30530 [Bacillus cereus]PFD72790.1 hypothetical protein CN271_13175 [Bacillus cereus]
MENQPNWQPIQNLPIIANLIDGQSSDAKEQYINLLEVRNKPHVLDDATIQRTIRVYTEQLEFVWIFEEQLSKWIKEERLTPIEQSEIERLQGQVQQLHHTLTDILALTEKLKEETYEKVMKKSDLQLGIESLQRIKRSDY